MRSRPALLFGSVLIALTILMGPAARADRPHKPVLHGQHWVAITGKPLGAQAGAMMFQRGGNAVDAACAMLAAVTTLWDTLSWGGETQALIYDPTKKKVVGINALGVAPTGATPEFFKNQNMKYPPEFGPLAAVTPGTPGGLFTMLAEFGTMSLADVLAPAIQLADGYPIEIELSNVIERNKARIKQWPYAKAVMLPHPGQAHEAPAPGEIFRQPDLAATLRKLVEAEAQALKAGKNRKQAIYAAYDRFYKGDIAAELVRSVKEQGGLFTMEDLARWQVHIEEPVSTTYRGIAVYKLTTWVQGPVMLQALNILENMDLKAMGYNSTRYLHAIYQAMNLAFADRDFYYGDPYVPPVEPIKGLLSKAYAKDRFKLINWSKNDPEIGPGDPYPYQGEKNPFRSLLERWRATGAAKTAGAPAGSSSTGATASAGPAPVIVAAADPSQPLDDEFIRHFYAGTTSIEAADDKGWVVSVTPSGGWVPAVIAGKTGVGLSQRMQSFVLDPAENPFNVVEPGKHPRATLTPTLALKDGKPYLSFAVQGGDSQDQNLLQFFLNVVEFGMNVQEACEAPNINSYQMRSSFGAHDARPGKMLINEQLPAWVRSELGKMGYSFEVKPRTTGPINAIFFDQPHGTLWGGSSDDGDDYGIAW
ncbi:MAG TPA: gamma-glutamyltransferase [Kofleriaceae bacterium]|jgi:gamma-glutamyltranspeptidase/glutathione hydrolase|nr:gamma-glutamyltransferase [Kofleriaceae bacterium]